MTAWETETGFNEMHTVLIISQDMEMAAVCEGLFKQKNCYVVHEATAYHALQTTRLLLPSLIIFDLELDQPEHIALCSQLRSLTESAILLLAPGDKNPQVLKYYQAGVSEHILTPVNPLALLIRSITWLMKQEHIPGHAQRINIYN